MPRTTLVTTPYNKPMSHNKETTNAYCRRIQELTERINITAMDLERERMLYLQLRNSRTFNEWRAMPPPLPVFTNDVDDDALGQPKTVEDCLEALYAFTKEEQQEIDINRSLIEDLEEVQCEDHQAVILHRRLIDDEIRRLDKTRLALIRLKRRMEGGNPDNEGVVRETPIPRLTLQDISNMTGSNVEGFDELGHRMFVVPEESNTSNTKPAAK